MTRSRHRLAPLAAALALACSPATHAVCADTIVVNSKADTVADDGKRTLREAIAMVPTYTPGCTTIRFNLPAGSRIGLASTLTINDRNVEIEGPGAGSLTITNTSLVASDRLLDIYSEGGGDRVTISGITFDGDADRNGASEERTTAPINFSGAGDWTLNGVVVKDFLMTGGAVDGVVAVSSPSSFRVIGSSFNSNITAGSGAALTLFASMSGSDFQVRNSQFRHNESEFDGAAIYFSGGSSDLLTVQGSTFAYNESGRVGGALAISGGTATVLNSTFSGNKAADAGGALSIESGDMAVSHSTIVRNQSGGVDGALTTAANAFTGSHNIVSLNTALGSPSNSVGDATFTYSLVNKPADKLKLTALQDNGGPTPTHLPRDGSIAIDAGRGKLGTAPARDQRGKPRLQGDAIDIGAVEAAP